MLKWLLGLVTLALLAVTPQPAYADHRNCTAAEKKAADRQLWLSEGDKQLSIKKHLPWGAPVGVLGSNEWLLVQRDYVTHYDGDLRIPLLTAERVGESQLKSLHRTDCFRR